MEPISTSITKRRLEGSLNKGLSVKVKKEGISKEKVRPRDYRINLPMPG